MVLFFGGIERIRTAVAAFAELSLATRPRCLIPFQEGKYSNKIESKKGWSLLSLISEFL